MPLATLAVAESDRAIHDHRVDSNRILKRLGVCRRVVDRRGIEHDDVGGQLRCYATAVAQMNTRRRQCGHLVDRLREGERLSLPNVSTQHAGKRTEPARMRMAAMCRTLRRERAAIAADHALRMRENAIEIVFAH